MWGSERFQTRNAKWFASLQAQKREGTLVENVGGPTFRLESVCSVLTCVGGQTLKVRDSLFTLNVFLSVFKLRFTSTSSFSCQLAARRCAPGSMKAFKSRSDVRSEKMLLREENQKTPFSREQTELGNEAAQRSEGSTGTVMLLAAANEARK